MNLFQEDRLGLDEGGFWRDVLRDGWDSGDGGGTLENLISITVFLVVFRNFPLGMALIRSKIMNFLDLKETHARY